MAARPRMRPAHWIVLILVLAPAWKIIERIGRPGPKAVSARTMAAGQALFDHEWTERDPLTGGDGLGPVYNARSCVDCHRQGAPGGGGPIEKNVTVYGLATPDTHGIPRAGVVHASAVKPEFQETLNLVHPALPREPSIPLAILTDRARPRSLEFVVTQRNTPALFGDGLIDAISEETIIAHQREHSDAARLVGLNGARDPKVRGRVSRLADGRIGRFGWKLEFATLNDFVKAACANELGLSNPGRAQAKPLGKLAYQSSGTDLTEDQCTLMTDFVRGLATPRMLVPADPADAAKARRGRELFTKIGCADCHSESLGPAAGIYSDMLLHDMGIELESSTGYYGAIIPPPNVPPDQGAPPDPPTPGEWRTAPLWGVADSAPYLHDGRAESLEKAIELHGGEAGDMAVRFANQPPADREAILTFLQSLRAPAPEAFAAR